jgi:LmbE family N-acetylglucosaminyl deacetylase
VARRLEAPGNGTLPAAAMVLAVIARPGQESAELGILLSAFRLHGAGLAVLCLTRGEGSEINSTCERLEVVRPWELQVAAGVLGVSSVTIADYPDGRLSGIPPTSLTGHIQRTARRTGADLLLVADPAAAADPDVAAVARAACLAARHSTLAVLARTLPGPGERWPIRLGEDGLAARMRQRHAINAHSSQCSRGPGGTPAPAASAAPAQPGTSAGHAAQDVSELVRWLVPPAPAGPAG